MDLQTRVLLGTVTGWVADIKCKWPGGGPSAWLRVLP